MCYICNNGKGAKSQHERPFISSDPKVRDHDHLTGKDLGSAHQSCNLNKRRKKLFLSIFFHRFLWYDSHLILPFFYKSYLPEVETISVIPKSGEKFMSIKIDNRIRMLDSMNYLSSNLENLFQSIKSSCPFSFMKQSSLLSSNINHDNKRSLKKNFNERLELLVR